MKRKLLLLRCGTGVLACLASACPSWLGAAVLLLPVLCSSALPAQTEVPLDRIAMTVGKDVITETEVLDEIRVTALLNGDPLDVSPKTRRAAAERLVDQRLIRQDMRAVEYPEPEASEAERVLRDLRRQRFPGDAAFREALERYGVSEDQLKRHLQWQLAALRFTDYRFRAGMPAPTGGVNSNGHTNGVRALPRRVDQQMEQWLEQARQRTRIQFREGVFQ